MAVLFVIVFVLGVFGLIAGKELCGVCNNKDGSGFLLTTGSIVLIIIAVCMLFCIAFNALYQMGVNR